MIIAGLGTVVAPAALAALPPAELPQSLVLSGRVVGPDEKPLSGAIVVSGIARADTDADGRFVLTTTTPRYRVNYRGRSAEGSVSNQHTEAHGTTWRASIGLTLA